MFSVVKFLEEGDAPGVVCTHWISDDETTSRYPNVRSNEARDKLLKRVADPDQDWSSCLIKILHKYNTFGEAIRYLRKAEETSNLESEDETICSRPRKRYKTSLTYPGEESDEDCSRQQSQKATTRNNIPPYPVPPRVPISTSMPNISPYPVPHISTSMPTKPSIHPAASAHSGQNIINGKIVAWMSDISSKVKDLEGKIDLILENQAKLLQQHHTVPVKTENLDHIEVLGSLPVGDDASFMELNNKISKEGHFRHLLLKVLTSVGGKDMRSQIHNMLRRVLSDEVAEIYSLSGKSTVKNIVKKPFSSTELSRLIFSASQRVFKDVATEVKVKEIIGEWLHQAKVRRNRRMQRQEKSIERNTEFQSL